MSAKASPVRDGLDYARRFLRPLRKNTRQEPFPPQLPPGRVVAVPGRGEMFVREEGRGEVITLLHGWTLSADLNWFSGVYDIASRRGRMVAPDIRGHGRGLRSEKPFNLEAAADDVAALLVELGIERTTVVGYSMGGSIGLLLADRHPQLISGLVLVATALEWRASLRERLVWLGLSGVEYVMRFGAPEGITDRYLRSAVEESPDLEPLCGWLKAEARRGDPSDIAAAGRALSAFDARDLAPSLRVPAAVIVTRSDQLVRAFRQRELAAAIPGASLIELDGAHNAWMVRPKEFATAVDEGLDVVLEQHR